MFSSTDPKVTDAKSKYISQEILPPQFTPILNICHVQLVNFKVDQINVHPECSALCTPSLFSFLITWIVFKFLIMFSASATMMRYVPLKRSVCCLRIMEISLFCATLFTLKQYKIERPSSTYELSAFGNFDTRSVKTFIGVDHDLREFVVHSKNTASYSKHNCAATCVIAWLL